MGLQLRNMEMRSPSQEDDFELGPSSSSINKVNGQVNSIKLSSLNTKRFNQHFHSSQRLGDIGMNKSKSLQRKRSYDQFDNIRS